MRGDMTELSNIIPGVGKPWKQQYDINTEQSGDITGWTIGPSLPEPLADSQAIVTKNRVYLLGGHNGDSFVSTVYTAPINEDGILGSWTTGPSLPEPLADSQAIIIKDRVYLLGGDNGSSYLFTSYVASINPDGTLGAWTKGPLLPVSLLTPHSIITKNRISIIAVINTYTAPISQNGTIGTWTTGVLLPKAISRPQAIVTKNRVYLLGGWGSITALSTVYTATINANGRLGVWTTGPSLPGPLAYSQAIVTKKRVYLLGGRASSYTYVSTVYTAPINPDGTLGTWTTGPSLPGPLANSQAIVTKGRVYLLGGDNGSNVVSTVYTAPILGGLNDYSFYYSKNMGPI